jgi:hypothetical protein
MYTGMIMRHDCKPKVGLLEIDRDRVDLPSLDSVQMSIPYELDATGFVRRGHHVASLAAVSRRE